MTTIESKKRDRRLIYTIESVSSVNELLAQYTAVLQITIENATIVLRGELPSSAHKNQLIPAIRQAGVLNRVSDHVRVAW
jgi:hypothetical protein